MPHRGRNVLIDSYEDDGPDRGRATLTIDAGDAKGRDVFLVRGESGLVYSDFFLVEHAALNSVMILREDMGGGRLAYFSVVTGFESHGVAAAGTPLVSRVTRTKDRREFRVFLAEVATADGRPLLTTGFMAFLAPRGERPDVRGTAAPPAGFCRPAPGRFPCFHPALVFCGEPDAAGRRGGVYPDDHPLCAGHFPGAPVMMGMTQWLAVAQRAALEAPPGAREVFGDGALLRADGAPVAEVTGLRAAVARDPDGNVTSLRLLATRKVSFRGMIFPGDAYEATFTPSGLE